MTQSYWEIRRLIVEDEQQEKARAEYSRQQLQQLLIELTEHHGKNFDATSLRNVRQFYLTFPIREILPLE